MDENGTIYIHLAGRPLSDGYDGVTERAHCAMEAAIIKLQPELRNCQKNHRRGPFVTINVGVSSGTGNAVRLFEAPIIWRVEVTT